MNSITKEDLETLRHQLFADLKALWDKPSINTESEEKEEKEWLRSRDVK